MRPFMFASTTNKTGSFWLSPDGELFDSPGEHMDSIMEIAPDVVEQYNRNNFGGPSPASIAMDFGWSRVLRKKSKTDTELSIDLGNGKNVEWALGVLPIEFLQCKTLLVDTENKAQREMATAIKVLKGEDAVSAWKNRNDPKHKIRGALTAAKDLPEGFSVVFDFDGTLTIESSYPEITAINEEVAKRVRQCKEAGLRVIISSCRWSKRLHTQQEFEAHRTEVTAFLKENNVPFDDLWFPDKPMASFYCDDLAVDPRDLQRLDLVIAETTEKQQRLGWPDDFKKPQYGCLMLDLPVDAANQMQAWSQENLKDEMLYDLPTSPGKYGREEHSHITCRYGFELNITADEIEAFLNKFERMFPLKVKLGAIGKFSKPEYDVIKIDVDSSELKTINMLLCEFFGGVNTFPDYKPHATLGYVLPGTGDHLIGQTPFAGQELEMGDFDFSTSDEPTQSKHTKFSVVGSELPSVEAKLKIKSEENLICPFCKDTDFDSIGLKDHIKNGFCEPCEEVEDIKVPRMQNLKPQGILHAKVFHPLVFADQLTELYKAATAYVQEDPKFANYLQDPEKAKTLGALQKALSEARSEKEIQKAWETHQPSISFEELKSRCSA